VEAALRALPDEVPPAGLREQVLARARAVGQAAPAPRPAAVAGAAPLLALLPVIALLVDIVRRLAAVVAGWTYWQQLAPKVPAGTPFVLAALALLVAGGLASLALAPALVLENKKA
jgi:hypothetical protein